MSDGDESKLLVLIESVRNLSSITANHDALLTKLVDDHEQRIRGLEKCALAIDAISSLEKKFEKEHISVDKRIRTLENWRWYTVGVVASILTVFEIYSKLRG